jgi:hypothetical protein
MPGMHRYTKVKKGGAFLSPKNAIVFSIVHQSSYLVLGCDPQAAAPV